MAKSLAFISLRTKLYIMKLKIIVLFITLITSSITAQNKVGTINEDKIINLMPEAKTVVKMAQEYGAKLDSSFSIKLKDFQERLDKFRKEEKEMGELMKKTVMKELADLEQEVKRYQDNGNKLMQLKQQELMRPLYKKLNDVITEIAKKEGYSQILTTTGNQFAYIDEKFDITKLVMDKLGIKEPEVKE